MVDPVSAAASAAGKALEKAANGAPGPPVTTSELDTGEIAPETLQYLTQASGGPFGELAGSLGDRLRFRRWKRALERADEARRILAARGREPRHVPDNVLVPLLEGASLAEDNVLADMWAALIANATDPDADEVPPNFADILRQLSPADALLLDAFASLMSSGADGRLPVKAAFARIDASGRDLHRYELSLDNLYRQRLLLEATPETWGAMYPDEGREAAISTLGYSFLDACRRGAGSDPAH